MKIAVLKARAFALSNVCNMLHVVVHLSELEQA